MFISILGMINPQLTHQIREPGRSGWRRRGCEGRAGMAPEASKNGGLAMENGGLTMENGGLTMKQCGLTMKQCGLTMENAGWTISLNMVKTLVDGWI